MHLPSECCPYYSILLAALLIIPLLSSGQRPAEIAEIRGVYGNPQPLWDKAFNLEEVGINAIFVHSGSITRDMMDRARLEGARVFAEFATLNGKDYVDEHPEAWPINEKGERVSAASWFMGVCPTEPGFRKYRFDQLRKLLSEYDLDGVWMDYVHWHAQFEEPEPILPETCFCNRCLERFSEHSGIEIPDETTSEKAAWILNSHDEPWRDWRCEVIHDWAKEMKSIIREIRPKALLGLYHCPWNDQEFDGARRRILGLDYDRLKETIDVFSPMVYHARMGRKPAWVQENVEWLCRRLEIKEDRYPNVWPIVQAHDDPEAISSEDFEIVLTGGLAGESTGVMMFTTQAVAADEGKTEVMKKVYTERIENAPDSIAYFGKAHFLLEGTTVADSAKECYYDRLPHSYQPQVRPPVWSLSKSSAGLSIRFLTNSTSIRVKWSLLNNTTMNHMAETGIKGIDVYNKNGNHWQYVNTARPTGVENEALLVSNMDTAMREYRMYLPLYDGVTNLEVGIDSASLIRKPTANPSKPIVFYGTSITQGGCASRPGMAHTNIISRKLNVDCINFGFSGNGKMERPIAELIADIDAGFYVIECLPNMKAEEVRERTRPLVEVIRKKRPDVPIVFVENAVYEGAFLDAGIKTMIDQKNAALRHEVEQLRQQGVANLLYIDSQGALGSDHEGTVDGVHLTDVGFLRYADFLIKQFGQFGLVELNEQ